MDSIDYYNRYAVPYYEETVDVSMEEVMDGGQSNHMEMGGLSR